MANLQKLMQMAQIANSMNESNAQQQRMSQAEQQNRVAAAMQLMGIMNEREQAQARQQGTTQDLALRTRALDLEDANRKAQTGQAQNRNLLDALELVSGPNASPLAIEALKGQPGMESIGAAANTLTTQARAGAMEKARGMLSAVTDPAMRESLRPTLAQFPGAFDELVGQMYPPTQAPAGAVDQAYPVPSGFTDAGATGARIGQSVNDFLQPVNRAIVDLYPNAVNAVSAGAEGLAGAAGYPANLGRMSSWWDMLQPPPVAQPRITSRPLQQPQLTSR